MNRDTYARFLRSEAYKELLLGGKKKVSYLYHFPLIISFLSNESATLFISNFIWANTCKNTVHTHFYTHIFRP